MKITVLIIMLSLIINPTFVQVENLNSKIASAKFIKDFNADQPNSIFQHLLQQLKSRYRSIKPKLF